MRKQSNILVVDDEPGIRITLQKTLEDEGSMLLLQKMVIKES